MIDTKFLITEIPVFRHMRRKPILDGVLTLDGRKILNRLPPLCLSVCLCVSMCLRVWFTNIMDMLPFPFHLFCPMHCLGLNKITYGPTIANDIVLYGQ